MHRRKFIYLGTLSSVVLPLIAQNNPIVTRPEDATSMEELTDILFFFFVIGKDKSIVIKVPKVATSRGAIPVQIKSQKKLKRIIVTAPQNRYPLVGIFEVPKDAIVEYQLKIKTTLNAWKAVIKVFAVDEENRIYHNETDLEVALGGGCEG